MISIVDYGSGNIQAIATLLKRSNTAAEIVQRPEAIAGARRILLPGVGAFDQTMNTLEASGMAEAIRSRIQTGDATCLGICVGMHCLADSSEEGPGVAGLGLVPGTVQRFDTARIPEKPRLPHMGWNTVTDLNAHPLLAGIDRAQGFYFLHSYHYRCADDDAVIGVAGHGYDFEAVVGHDNVFGVQFHPEKSHSNGVRLIMNFAAIEPC